jgi:hypothetical protein
MDRTQAIMDLANEIEDMIEEMKDISTDHFYTNPDQISVNDIVRISTARNMIAAALAQVRK